MKRQPLLGRMQLPVNLLLGVLIMGLSTTQGQSRRWTSAQGSAIDAEVIEIAGDHVTLKRADGSGTVAVPFAKLSDADRTYVKCEWAARRMASTVVPELNLRNDTLETAIQLLADSSRAATPTPPELSLRLDSAVTNAPPLTLRLRRVTLADALKYITSLTSTKYVIDGATVTVLALSQPDGPMLSRAFPLPSRNILKNTQGGDDSDAGVQKFLKDCGVSFPAGSSVHADWDKGQVQVTSTAGALEQMNTLCQSFAVSLARVRYTVQAWEVSTLDASKLRSLLAKDQVPTNLSPGTNMRQALALFDGIRKTPVTTFGKTVTTGEPVLEKKRSGSTEIELACSFDLIPPNVLRLSAQLAAKTGKRTSALSANLSFLDNERCISVAKETDTPPNAFAKGLVLTATAQLVDPYGHPIKAVEKAVPQRK